jgi:hypothetical protein
MTISCSEANGGTPLHVAASYNHVLTAHILVQVALKSPVVSSCANCQRSSVKEQNRNWLPVVELFFLYELVPLTVA